MGNAKETEPWVKRPQIVEFAGLVLVTDFENDPNRSAAMQQKIRKNLIRCKTIEAFRSWLVRDAGVAELELLSKLEKWKNIKDQIAYVDKIINGDIEMVDETVII